MASDFIVMCEDARLACMEVKVPDYLNTLTIRLFKNNYTPVVTSVLGDFTQATFPGYAADTLNDFGAPYINADSEAQSDTGVHTFTCTGVPSGGSQSIYGWYTEDTGGALGPAVRFTDGPIVLTGAG